MTTPAFQLEIVSVESQMYSGPARQLFVTGIEGEMEILANHAPLLTSLVPGPVWAVTPDGKEQAFVILGGTLEVQPDISIVLADAAMRASDIDEQAALDAKRKAEQMIAAKGAEVDYSAVHNELALALAQLRIIRKLRKGS